jgi:hypothetical protein
MFVIKAPELFLYFTDSKGVAIRARLGLRYNRSIRIMIYAVLHKEPYNILDETFTDLLLRPGFDKDSDRWLEGCYSLKYPKQDLLATIFVFLHWKRFESPPNPVYNWVIEAPESLYYPGRHSGQIRFRDLEKHFSTSRCFQREWLTPLLSPILLPRDQMSSSGRFEELSYREGFTASLESIAHFLMQGPQKRSAPREGSASGIQWGWGGDSGPASTFWDAGRDRFLHAAAFFSRAYTQLTPEEQHESIKFSPHFTREPVIAIQEFTRALRPSTRTFRMAV